MDGLTGTLPFRSSTLKGNVSEWFETRPGSFYLGHGPIDARRLVIR